MEPDTELPRLARSLGSDCNGVASLTGVQEFIHKQGGGEVVCGLYLWVCPN